MARMTAIKPPDTAPGTTEFSGTGTILNPATGAIAGQVQWTDPADVPAIAAGLRAAQRDWEQRGAKGRAKVLARFAVWLADHRGEIEELLIKETGKSAVDAAQEVPLLIMILSYYVRTMEKALEPERRPAALPFLAIKKITVYYRPRPVVGIIAPWNYPVANALMDGLGALAAGCAVLLKPSERTPLTAEVLRRGWLESGAPEVLALAQGAREVATAVIDNVDYVQFTGSSATGRKVMERAARRLTPVSLELGGKDPMIVLDDANLDLAIEGGLWGAFGTTGQRCTATSRIIVQKGVYHEFIERFVARAKKLKVGNGLDETVDMGPAVNENQLKTDLEYIEIGKNEGAKLVCGGNRLDKGEYQHGWFLEPTVFTDVDPKMRIAQEEIFGPVVSIIPCDDMETAIEIANNIEYGLSSALYTKDVNKAFTAVRDLEAGITYINAPTIGAEVHLPFGGTKATGNGHREGGIGAIDFYTEWKAVYVDYSDKLQKAQIDRVD